jgi:hypothetical protein
MRQTKKGEAGAEDVAKLLGKEQLETSSKAKVDASDTFLFLLTDWD